MSSSISFAAFSRPPPGYTPPPFPGLYWPPQVPVLHGSLYHLYDIWRFTMLWTVILYAIFHVGAALIALFVQLAFSGRPEYWRYLWTIPVVYGISAGAEALFAGSFVGLMYVLSTVLYKWLLTKQHRRGILGGPVLDVDVDPVHLGLGQCPDHSHFVLFHPGRSLVFGCLFISISPAGG